MYDKNINEYPLYYTSNWKKAMKATDLKFKSLRTSLLS